MILYVCETCETYSEVSHHGQQGHNVVGMQGDDYEELTRTAAAHIVLARHIRKGWENRNGLLAREMADARIYADWFSEEDSQWDGWLDSYETFMEREKAGPPEGSPA